MTAVSTLDRVPQVGDPAPNWAHVEERNGMRRENSELLAEIAKLS